MTDKDLLKEEINRLKKSIKLIEDGPNYGSEARIVFLTNQQMELVRLELQLAGNNKETQLDG